MEAHRTNCLPAVLALVASLGATSCGGPEPSRLPVRLVDVFPEATVAGTPETDGVEYGPTAWRFDGGDGTSGWSAAEGVADLRAEDGVLRGRSTSDRPVLVAARGGDVPDPEILHAVEVRARISEGARLSVYFDEGERPVVSRALGNVTQVLSSPVEPGDDMRTYVIRATSSRPASTLDHVLLVPTDASGADFEIESVRLVFRGEHLKSIPSGIGWHGMAEVYRETIVSRSPERVGFSVTLPAAPALELAMATTEELPAAFRVEVRPEGSDEPRVLSHEVTEPDAWHERWLELDGLDGENVSITLSLDAEEPGTLGFWGSPVVRSRSAAAASGDDPPAGVVLVITDTLRSDHLSFLGYERETAPTLARLASEGASFADAVSQATWTKVSVPAIQTALYPSTHTVAAIPDQLPASATTIAEVFRASGYATVGIASIPFVGQFTNLHQGYEVYHEYGAVGNERFKTAPEAVERLSLWIEEHRDTPFFAMLHVSDPHAPFRPLEEYETAFAEPGDMDRLDEMIEAVKPHIPPGVRRLFGSATREQLAAAGLDAEEFVRLEKAGYDGSILGMDEALGRLIGKLADLGLTNGTLLAVVSDHGTEFLEHGRHFHGHSVYGDLNRVPMLLWGPGRVPARGAIDATVQTIDLMPTILELSGLPVPEGVQGRSLVPLFSTEEAPSRPWAYPAITERASDGTDPAMVSIVSEGWKLVRIEEPDGPRFELYDHAEDPLNLHDVAGRHPDVVERLAERLEGWRTFAEAARLDDAKAAEQMDAAELERLRSLGYVR